MSVLLCFFFCFLLSLSSLPPFILSLFFPIWDSFGGWWSAGRPTCISRYTFRAVFLSRGTQSTVRSDKSPAYSVRLHLDILPPQALKHLCVPYLRSSRVHRCSHLFSPSKIEPESHAIRASFTTASCSVVISNYDFQEETKQLVVATDGFTWVNVHGKSEQLPGHQTLVHFIFPSWPQASLYVLLVLNIRFLLALNLRTRPFVCRGLLHHIAYLPAFFLFPAVQLGFKSPCLFDFPARETLTTSSLAFYNWQVKPSWKRQTAY